MIPPMARTIHLQLLAAVVFVLLGTAVAPAAPAPESATVARLHQLMALIQQHGVKEVPASRLTEGALGAVQKDLKGTLEEGLHSVAGSRSWDEIERVAVKGMLDQLNDRWAAYLSPEVYAGWRQRNTPGGFGGTGIQLLREGDSKSPIVIVEPWPDTPAAAAGLHGGDELVAIGGLETAAMSEEEARARLQAAPGTEVRLTVRREGQQFEKALVCVQLEGAVRSRLLEEDGHKLGLVEVRTFTTNTPKAVARALEELSARGAQGYLVDLRNNGGGTVTSAVQMASLFLPQGQPIVSIHRRSGVEVLRSSGAATRPVGPLLVLINENSASAAELTAGALRDGGKAVLIGSKSYGKGAVQRIVPLADGSALKLTTAFYKTPSGQAIDGQGLVPEVSVATPLKLVGGAADAQLQAAVELASRRLEAQKVGQSR